MIKPVIYGLCLTLILVCPLSAQSNGDKVPSFSWLDSNRVIANDYIVPRYQSLARSSKSLATAIDVLCTSNFGSNNLASHVTLNQDIADKFKTVYLDWAQIQHIKFGPVSFLKRLERLQYWPDKHNVGQRQVRKLLLEMSAGQEYALPDFQKKSVAVQGLVALERTLYTKDQQIDQQECLLAQLISNNIAAISNNLDQNWRLAPVEFANEFELANHGEGSYSSNDEITNLLADSLITQLLIISEHKLSRALPKELNGRVYPRRAEAWRSQLSLDIVDASLDSLYTFYRLAFSNRLKNVSPETELAINTQFKKVLSLSQQLNSPMADLLNSEQGIERIQLIKQHVVELEQLITSDMISTLGLASRFNALDGD